MKRVTLTILGNVVVDVPDDAVLPTTVPLQGNAIQEFMTHKGPDGSSGVLIKGLHIHSIFAALDGDNKEEGALICNGLVYSFGLLGPLPVTEQEKKAQLERLKKAFNL
jgi:hypothetical protein